jgi:hypothetical protein
MGAELLWQALAFDDEEQIEQTVTVEVAGERRGRGLVLLERDRRDPDPGNDASEECADHPSTSSSRSRSPAPKDKSQSSRILQAVSVAL